MKARTTVCLVFLAVLGSCDPASVAVLAATRNRDPLVRPHELYAVVYWGWLPSGSTATGPGDFDLSLIDPSGNVVLASCLPTAFGGGRHGGNQACVGDRLGVEITSFPNGALLEPGVWTAVVRRRANGCLPDGESVPVVIDFGARDEWGGPYDMRLAVPSGLLSNDGDAVGVSFGHRVPPTSPYEVVPLVAALDPCGGVAPITFDADPSALPGMGGGE